MAQKHSINRLIVQKQFVYQKLRTEITELELKKLKPNQFVKR